ncbi:STAS/SEC14 domain-containing protein [Pseudaestuariivita atlantica]|uniref:Universal stress protein UspA n=1 Tax=Pseudaestuariivita atlantica TaxID=1317121 RepID=A0A0L1JS78_9RHOB|nr:STAS/SEC14 domain-containing protein [Pseudaestuariivita atlantica]KNG94591.1 hypothetical protein ATO11_04080 [Pseudaestuariivita atlantica]
MFRILPESRGNVLGVEAMGELTHEDYANVLLPKLAELFEAEGKVNLLCHLGPEFTGWDLQAAWDDTLIGIEHRGDFERLAVVGGPNWIRALFRFSAVLMTGEVRVFDEGELDQAWDWVKGGWA